MARPVEIAVDAFEKGPGGVCRCGAIFLADYTGKNAGLLMAQALGMAADALSKKISELVPDEDYEDALLNYDWRTHRSTGVSAGPMDGYGRIYIFRVKRRSP